MMATFNISTLADFNYTETTHFIDPMEPRYRAKSIKDGEYASVDKWGKGDFSLQGVTDKVSWFASLDAYKSIDKVEAALEDYWGRNGQSQSASATPSTLLTATKSALSAATPTTLSTTKSSTTSTAKLTTTSTAKSTTTTTTSARASSSPASDDNNCKSKSGSGKRSGKC